jgi:hypothetical protein
MITLTREEAQQVLDALVVAEAGLADIGDADREPGDDLAWCEERAAQALPPPRKAIETLRARLAEPEKKQEPMAWFTEDYKEDKSATTYSKEMAERWEKKGWPVAPLYTAPPQREWVGLTVEEIIKIMWPSPASAYDLARAIEAKLKEKNK